MSGAAPAHPAAGARDPWARFGWLSWSVWLAFLVFPLLTALASPAPPAARAATVGLIVVFALAYGATTVRVHRDRLHPSRAVAALGVLVGLCLLTVPVLGTGAIAFSPFLVALGVFALPRPWCWAWVAVVLVTGASVVVLGGGVGEWGWFVLVLAGVSAATTGGRLVSEHAEAWDGVQRELALTGERDRVARDVHDVLGHSLTVVSVKAQLASRMVDLDPARARAELDDIARLTREALAEVRATVGGLRGAALDDELARAGAALGAAGIEADLPPDGAALDPSRRTVAAWVLREAVTNVVRHSGARRCRVRLAPDRVVVADDGVGCPGLAAGGGLRGLRERVAGSGGRLLLDAPEGGGTRLEVSW